MNSEQWDCPALHIIFLKYMYLSNKDVSYDDSASICIRSFSQGFAL